MKNKTRQTFKKIIVTNEKVSLINPKNIQMKKSFLKEKNTRSSDTTIQAYESDLNIFFVWNLDNNDNKFFIEIKKLEFANFFSYVTEELKWGSARFGRMRACLSSLSQFIEKFYDDEYPNFRNIILKSIESMPKSEAREKTIFSEKQIENLFRFLEDKDIQQACWLALAVGSGARFSELLRFNTGIIDEKNTAFNGIFLETIKPIKTKGRTKTGKLMNKYIVKDIFFPRYQKWLVERNKIMKMNGQDHDFVFIKKDGSPAVAGTIRSWINGMSSFMEVPVYPHAFRHYITTYLSKAGLPHQLIKELMGWANVNMVETYDDTTAKDKNWKELENLKTSI